jgi:hypothetical protein
MVAENPEPENSHGQSRQSNIPNISASPVHSPSRAAKAILENKDLFVSPHNLRVRSRDVSEDMRQDLDEGTAKKRTASVSFSKIDEASKKDILVKDRSKVKSDSADLLKSAYRNQHKSSKKEKKDAVFNRLYGSKV